MSEAIQSKRRKEKVMDWLATLLAAALLAAMAALLVEASFALIGLAIGDLAWHRSLTEKQIGKLTDWLQGLPLIGILGESIKNIQSLIPGDGVWRDLMALCILFLFSGLTAFPARRIGPTLIARYDDETLRPKPPVDLGMRWAGPLGEHQVSAWQKLREWCFENAGTGATPFWKPWQMPDVSQAFSIAILTGVNGVGKSHLAEALSRELDGSLQLEACTSTFERWRLKLRVKLHECLWWRTRRPDQPWDCGYLVEDPAARKRLGQFLPRRSTLLVADELQGDSLIECLTDLSMRRAEFRHPVRLLIIDATPPSALRLAWDTRKLVWKTDLQELGEVTTVDLSGVCFDVAQFRGLVGAQVRPSQEKLYLTGDDDHWDRFVKALEFQPILETEAIRLVRDSGIAFDDLLVDKNLPDTLVDRQEQRDTPRLPPDLYGKERDVLRERILSARAEHRESALLIALGLSGKNDETYLAVMLASMANGASVSRLTQLIGWKTDRLSREHIVNIFGSDSIDGWVPSIKPAVIADELLRRYFNAPRGASLSVEIREKVAGAMRSAWLANPGGTVATAKRWAKQRLQDDFAKSLQRLPDLKDLQEDPLLSPSMRIDLVRGMFELAILHEADIAPAQAALDELEDGEIPAFEKALNPLLSDPGVHGLPALCLWLRLVKRRLSMPEQLPRNVDEYLITLLELARHLVRQVVLVYSPPEPLREPLFEAVAAVLPAFSRVARSAAGNASFRAAIVSLDQRLVFSNDLFNEITDAIRAALGLQLIAFALPPGGEPELWARTLIELLEKADIHAASSTWEDFSCESWTISIAVVSLSRDWGQVRAISSILYLLASLDAERTGRLAVMMSDSMRRYPTHAGIQYQCAMAWRMVAVAYRDIDAARCEHAAQVVGEIAQPFPTHEDIQHAYAVAWGYVAMAYKDKDAMRCEQAAKMISEIAQRFPANEGIQHEFAQAWRFVASAFEDIAPACCEQSAQVVSEIAKRYPAQEMIQYEHAVAWRNVASAFEDIDVACSKHAAEVVSEIAQRFPAHEGIQREYLEAWRHVAWAYMDIDAARCEQAAEVVSEIAQRFPAHETIQHEYAVAWRFVASAFEDIAPACSKKAAQVVSEIAQRFPAHEGIQREHAEAWRHVTWAYKDSDTARIKQAVQVVSGIAQRFPAHEGIQLEYAVAWRYFAQACKYVDVACSKRAAQVVSEIAQRFPAHEDIQRENAEAWRAVAVAYSDIDAAYSKQAAQVVSEIAQRFPVNDGIQHEYAQAWCLVVWAYKDIDLARCEQAAKVVRDIAQNCSNHKGIQFEYAKALRYSVESAVKFDDPVLIKKALLEIDRLSGKTGGMVTQYSSSSRMVSPAVLKECASAYATYEAWRTKLKGDGAIEA